EGRRVSLGLEAWRRFRRHRLAVASAALLGLIILTVVLEPLWWQVPINDIDFAARLAGPSWQHPFGTDDLGQDLFARLLYGGAPPPAPVPPPPPGPGPFRASTLGRA